MHLKAKDQELSRNLVADIMAEQLGHDETLTKQLIPPFALGCRRMTPGSGYLQSLKADNVQVIPKSATKLTETGIIDADGNEHEVDVVICATGFDTSFTPHFKVYGRRNAEIHEQFGDFPIGYLGVSCLSLGISPNNLAERHISTIPSVFPTVPTPYPFRYRF
jgi:cation diffusion facilitator CzcD-associated flavoprotein CzcO